MVAEVVVEVAAEMGAVVEAVVGEILDVQVVPLLVLGTAL